MIRLLIVDDSALMRRKLASLFTEAGEFEVRLARNGAEAVAENRAFQPDVVTLDINMPEMDGLESLACLMHERPVPVIMFSSLTVKSALATFEALALGAVDCVAKPGGTISRDIESVEQELLEKVRIAARARPRVRTAAVSAREPRPPRATPVAAPRHQAPGLVLVGVSTGGPSTLEDILPKLPAEFPWPILIAQHMPASFTAPFAQRLNGVCRLPVQEVRQATALEPGNIYIARGDADVKVSRRGARLVAVPCPAQAQFLWHPSVELLGRSALEHCPAESLIGVMLTGMGHDGSQAFSDIHRRGGRTIAEAEETAVIFGMPAKLIEQDGASTVLPAGAIARQLVDWTR